MVVVGGAGFVGAHLCRSLAEAGEKVVSYDLASRLLAPIQDASPEVQRRLRVVPGNATDAPTLFRVIREAEAEGLIYAAAVLLTADHMPTEALRVNVEGFAHACEAARVFDLRRVVYFSSQGVYGATRTLDPLAEDAPLAPDAGMYQLTKYFGERLAEQYAKQYRLSIVAVRPSMVFGPGQTLYYPLNMILAHAAKDTRLMRKDGGDHPIDYTYVKDCAEGAALAYRASKPRHLVYNISGGRLHTNRQVIELVRKVFPKFEASVGPGLIARPPLWKRILSGPLDLQRARRDLSYEPRYGLEGGLIDYAAHLRDTPTELEQMVGALVRPGDEWS